MYIAYQPIVRLPQRDVAGYEALARFESGQSPDEAFEEAWQKNRGMELEAKAIRMAIEQFPHSIDEAFLAVNASAKTIIAMKGELTKDPGLEIPWPNLVIELSEKYPVDDYRSLGRSLSVLRHRQARLAVDDYGAGNSSFKHISLIDPSFIKIDRTLIQNIGENSTKQSTVGALVYFANLERSKVIAEGIETEDEAECCEDLGVHYGQGYLFGKPQPFNIAKS